MPSVLPDTLAVLNALPGNYLILLPDAPTFTIAGVTDAYLRATYTQRETLLGKGVFEAFPDSTPDQQGRVAVNLGASLREVLTHKRPHAMADQRYDVGNPLTGQVDVRIWQPLNQPVLDAAGEVAYIIHAVGDTTETVQLREAGRLASQQQQAFLLRLSDRLRLLSDPTDIQYQAACVLGEYTGASRVGYAEDGQDGQTIVVTRNYTKGVQGIEGRYRYEDYGAELMTQLQAGHTVIRPDVANDPLLTDAEKLAHARLQLGATLNKPLVKAGQLVAVLFLHFDGPHAFTEHELSLLEETAERTWEAVGRARAEGALRASEARFRTLIEEAPVATMLVTGPGHVFELVNESMIRLVGRGASIIGKPVAEAIPELATQPFLSLLNQVFATGLAHEAKAMPGELLIDGVLTRRYFDFTYKPVRNQAGEVYGIISMAVDVTEQVLVRQRIEQSQQQLLALFEQSPAAIAILSEDDLTFRLANPFYAQLVGRRLEDLLDKPLLEALPELRGQGFDHLLREVMQTGVPYTAAEAVVELTRQGQSETIYVDLVYQPWRDADGRLSRVFVVATDVTQQVRSRKAVEASEAQLRSIIDESPVAMALLMGPEFRIEMANPLSVAHMGKGPSVIGQPVRDAMPELEHQPFLHLLTDVFTTGKPFEAKASPVQIVVDGAPNVYYFDLVYKPLRTAAGEVYAILATSIDVTQQVTAQMELAQQQTYLQNALAIADLGTYAFDVASDMGAVSENVRRWFGMPSPHEPMPDLLSRVHPDDLPRVRAVIEAALQSETHSGHDFEYRVINPALGGNLYIRSFGKAQYKGGKAEAVIGVLQNVTEQVMARRKLEDSEARLRQLSADLEAQVQARTAQLQASVQELRRSNDNLQQFAYVASHDLQEPLRKIQSFGDILRNQYAEGLGDGVGMLERMQSAASRMSTLIRDLLTFSRISTQQDATALVSLNAVVDHVLSDLDMRIEETHAQVDVEPLPTLAGDASQLRQLFQNLLGNALKFSQPNTHPRIRVSYQRVAAADLPVAVRPIQIVPLYDRIDVADNGIGFEEKYVDRIFQVFQRLHGKNSAYGGTGIGLAICEKVAANHGGAITASSQPGSGATFSVYLPA